MKSNVQMMYDAAVKESNRIAASKVHNAVSIIKAADNSIVRLSPAVVEKLSGLRFLFESDTATVTQSKYANLDSLAAVIKGYSIAATDLIVFAYEGKSRELKHAGIRLAGELQKVAAASKKISEILESCKYTAGDMLTYVTVKGEGEKPAVKNESLESLISKDNNIAGKGKTPRKNKESKDVTAGKVESPAAA